ncbi:MAG: hypothetical protein R3C52_11250 [Hyphomonadaceae bacterium]
MKPSPIALASAAVAAALLAAPAFADGADTIKLMIANGATFDIGGQVYDLTYLADGKFDDPVGGGGEYRVDGATLCHTPVQIGQEICTEIPADKKEGDTFELTSDLGPLIVTIK